MRDCKSRAIPVGTPPPTRGTAIRQHNTDAKLNTTVLDQHLATLIAKDQPSNYTAGLPLPVRSGHILHMSACSFINIIGEPVDNCMHIEHLLVMVLTIRELTGYGYVLPDGNVHLRERKPNTCFVIEL